MIDFLPLGFLFAILTLVGLAAEAAYRFDLPWSRPALMVYFTVGMWYHADFIYNDPFEFCRDFNQEVLNQAWCEVCWFLLCFRWWLAVIMPIAMRGFVKDRVSAPEATAAEQWPLLKAVATVWAALMVVAFAKTGGDFVSLVCPPLSEAGFAWARGGVGGATDFLVSAGEYTNLAVCGLFGVFVALGVTPRMRWTAAGLFVAASGMFVFNNARNRVLTIVLPGLLAYLLVSRVSVAKKLTVAAVVFFVLSSWFLVILNQRNSGFHALRDGENVLEAGRYAGSRHLGLDMFRELCYVNVFIEDGRYEVKYGSGYLAEAVAFVPRAIWPGKPLPRIDYAIARGFGARNTLGARATIAMGLIGQGVANFGGFLGPAAAAGLIACWAAILGRQWAERRRMARLLLLLIGMGVTVNLGRDITFQVLFPFVFAYLGVRVYEHLREVQSCP